MMIIMRRGQSPRRGVAMLLVLISLGMATIIATSYLSSRDNSYLIGQSVADAAVARWTADSGLELTIAILETHTDWRTAHTGGVLLDGYPLAGGTVRIELLDLETLQPPNAATRAVEITSVGASNGHHQITTAEAHILEDGTNLVNVDLAEFAAFTTANMVLNDNALIAMWPESPARHLNEGIALGTQGTALGTVAINGDAAIIDGTVYTGPGASSSLVLNANSPLVEVTELQDQMPALAPPPPGVLSPDEDDTVYSPYSPSGLVMLNSNQRWASFSPAPSTYVATSGHIQLVSEGDFHLGASTAMIVDGNLQVVVYGDMIMDSEAFIELKKASSLKLYVAGEMRLNDAYIGDLRTTDERALRDTEGYEGYMDPSRVLIYSINDGSQWTMEQQSLVQGAVYAPTTDLVLQDSSALYGRAAVESLTMYGDAALFYDPALNNGTGYTNPESEIFGSDGGEEDGGGLLDTLLSVTDLSADSLTQLANDAGVAILHDGVVYGTQTSTTSTTSPGDPTPRIVYVDYMLSSFGSYIGSWETSDGTTTDFTTTGPKRTAALLESP